MKRFSVAPIAALVIGLALGATALSGCDEQWGPYAARVNGTSISTGQLNAALSSAANDSGYKCVLELATGKVRINGPSGTHSYDMAFADSILTNMVVGDVLHQRVESLHLTEPSSARILADTAITDSFSSRLSSNPGCQSTGASALSGLGSVYRQSVETSEVDQYALAAQLAGTSLDSSALQSFETRHASATTESCTSVIEVTSKSKATTIRSKIESGTPFSTEAGRYSIVPGASSSGGSIGCGLPSQLPSPINTDVARLHIGQVTQPVKYQNYWLLLTVTEHHLEPVGTLLDQLLSSEQQGYVHELTLALKAAHIDVATEYGHWDAATNAVVQPNSPKSADVPDLATVLGPYQTAPGSSSLGTGGSSSSTGGTGSTGGSSSSGG